MAFVLKIKTTDGVKRIEQLLPQSTFEDLKVAIGSLINCAPSALSILHGFPPKKLVVPEERVSLSELNICHGDCLQAEEDSAMHAPSDTNKKKEKDTVLEDAGPTHVFRGILTRHTVPADNSCLFTSVDFVLNNGRHIDKTAAMRSMRRIIAEMVTADPAQYNQALLDNKPNADYCAWILDESSWGGAIELNILSTHFAVEIDVVDTRTGRIDRFGEAAAYRRRVLLIYDGIHYDPLALESADGLEKTTTFSTDDDEILSQALELGHEAKSSRQFTDVDTFRLRCLDCQVIVAGQTGAIQHTKTTGHVNFGEM